MKPSTDSGDGVPRPPASSPGGHSELLRKTFHMGAGSGALLLRWTGWGWGLAMVAVGVFFNAVLLHRITGGRLLRSHEAARGDSWGSLSYPVMVFLLVLAAPRHLDLAAAAWGILALGDGAAGLVGKGVGGPVLPWNRRKRWSGLAAFVVVSWPAAALLAWWTGQGGGAAATSGMATGALVVACGLAALVAAVAESLDSALDDNILIPLAAGLTLAAAAALDPSLAAGVLASVPGSGVVPGAAGLTLAALAALALGAVTPSGAVGGWALVTTLLAFGGWDGVFVFSAFFAVGTGATWMGHQRKAALGVAHRRGGRRGATHALANAGTGMLFAVLAGTSATPEPFVVAMVAAFATAAFDTTASEVGQAYGRSHVLLGTFRRVAPGTEGAVSVEGTVGGAAGAGLVALVAGGLDAVGWLGALCALVGAGAGSMAESVAGTVLTRQGPADNGLLNVGATLVGAGVAVAVWALLT